jgi:hypothetical protein
MQRRQNPAAGANTLSVKAGILIVWKLSSPAQSYKINLGFVEGFRIW